MDPEADGDDDEDEDGDQYAGGADGQGMGEHDANQMEMDADEMDQDKQAEYGEEMGDDDVGFSNSAADLNQEELEAIIESITSGKSQ